MINASSKTTSLLKEINYNKITILISLLIILLAQTYPQYVYGPIFWAEFLILIFLFAAMCSALGCLGLICFFGLGSMFFVVPLKPFTINFWNALTFAGNPEQYGLAAVFLQQKDYFLTHPALVSFYTSLAFLAILWRHPDPYEERCAHSPMKIFDCIIKYTDIKIIATIFIITCLFTNKLTATIATWTIVYFILLGMGKKEFIMDNFKFYVGYLVIFGSYAISKSDKSLVDAILGIIMLNP